MFYISHVRQYKMHRRVLATDDRIHVFVLKFQLRMNANIHPMSSNDPIRRPLFVAIPQYSHIFDPDTIYDIHIVCHLLLVAKASYTRRQSSTINASKFHQIESTFELLRRSH
jgi:hypothetical protein